MKKVNVLNLAAYIKERYAKENNNEQIDEMKIHKLLYFAQREALILFNTPLFDADFHAWKYGPVLHEVRAAYKDDTILKMESLNLTDEQKTIMDYVFEQYSKKSSWSLSRLTHGEYSWKHARKGISEYENSDAIIPLEEIRYDAKRQLNRRNKLRELGLLE